MPRLHRLYLNAQGGVEGGSSSDQQAVTPTSTTTAADPSEGYKKLLEKHNNDVAIVANKLYDENHSYRQKNADLKAKVPADGSLVLNADQGKLWAAYLELGKPEEITALKAEHGRFATDRATVAKEKLHAAAADAHGYKVGVLSRTIDSDGIEVVEIKEGKDNAGKDIKTVIVKDKVKDEDITLPEYVKRYLPQDLAESLPKTPAVKPIGTPRTGTNLSRNDVPAEPPLRSLVR